MKIKQWFAQFFKKNNLEEKAKTGQFSKEEFEKIEAACKSELKMSFVDALAKMHEEETNVQALEEAQKAILASIFAPNAAEAKQAGEGVDDPKAQTAVTEIAAQKKMIEDLTSMVQALANENEKADPLKLQGNVKRVGVFGGSHTEKHLFGIEAPFFEMSKPWNIIAATRKGLDVIGSAKGISGNWDDHEKEFCAAVASYGKSLGDRYAALQATGEFSRLSMASINVDGFTGTGWGNEFIKVRQDVILIMIRELNSVSGIFPIRYGVQNKEAMLNAFFGQFSQSFQSGRVFKGNSAIEPIEARVFKLMFKHKFSDMKDIETQYIGYMNKEANDPMKWTMVEWLLVQMLIALMNEWNERRIIGYRVDPETGKPGHFLHGSDGVLWQLMRWAFEEFRLQPVTSISTYTESTIIATFKAFIAFAYTKVPSLKGYKLHFNEKHLPWYLADYRTNYGKDFDFKGGKLSIMDYPDIEMVPVPNMGSSFLLILTKGGNIQLLETAAGEMAKIGMQRDLEELMVFSYWAEGVGADMVGKKFATAAALAADDYRNQYIFISNPFFSVAANATTIDATKSLLFKTVENSQATVITDITGARAGVVYRIQCDHMGNASSIAKSGKFSAISEAYTPGAIGDYIDVYLYYNEDDKNDALNNKFIDVARKVTA